MILLEDISTWDEERIERETKKINKETEKKIKEFFKTKPKFNPIDKFTSVDELLKENIKQQHLTNQLLLALCYKKEKDGKIVSIQPNGIDTSAIIEGLKGGDNYKTMVKNITSTITGSENVFGIKGTGILAEVKFQSSNANVNNKAYSVRILSDKDIIYNGTWSNFESRSYYEADMTAYEDAINGYYILSFKKVAYLKNLKIEVYESSATFTNIYIKYHERG